MSLEMKYAGGIKRAIEEIEFFVELNGNLDRFAPFPGTLPFYQRWLIDLFFIFLVLSEVFGVYLVQKCADKRIKVKED